MQKQEKIVKITKRQLRKLLKEAMAGGFSHHRMRKLGLYVETHPHDEVEIGWLSGKKVGVKVDKIGKIVLVDIDGDPFTYKHGVVRTGQRGYISRHMGYRDIDDAVEAAKKYLTRT